MKLDTLRCFQLVLVLALCSTAAGCVRTVATGQVPASESPNSSWNCSIQSSPVEGSLSAPIKITVFSDFECRSCRLHARTLRALRTTYPESLALVFKNYPLRTHKESFGAALTALAAGRQGKFWEMHDLLFSNQALLGQKTYARFAESLELDMERFRRDMSDPASKRDIFDDISLGVSWGVSGTPTSFVNDERVSGAGRLQTFEEIIEKHLQMPSLYQCPKTRSRRRL